MRYLAEEVVGLDRRGRQIEAARLASGGRLEGDLFVNAAGPWAARVAGFAAIDLPVRARRRVVGPDRTYVRLTNNVKDCYPTSGDNPSRCCGAPHDWAS